jgi:hypothetical protein
MVLPTEVQPYFTNGGRRCRRVGVWGWVGKVYRVNLGMGEWMMLRFLACIYGLSQAGLTYSSDAYSGSPRVTKCTGYCVSITSAYLASLDGGNLIYMRGPAESRFHGVIPTSVEAGFRELGGIVPETGRP